MTAPATPIATPATTCRRSTKGTIPVAGTESTAPVSLVNRRTNEYAPASRVAPPPIQANATGTQIRVRLGRPTASMRIPTAAATANTADAPSVSCSATPRLSPELGRPHAAPRLHGRRATDTTTSRAAVPQAIGTSAVRDGPIRRSERCPLNTYGQRSLAYSTKHEAMPTAWAPKLRYTSGPTHGASESSPTGARSETTEAAI